MQSTSTRPSYLAHASATRTRQASFPSLTRGSSSLSTPASSPSSPTVGSGAWGSPAPSPPISSSEQAPAFSKRKGPSLSFQAEKKDALNGTTELHPLKHTWDVYFSHRHGTPSSSSSASTAQKKEKDKLTNGSSGGGKEKESREEWEGAVVKLGGFSSIESLHPFLAHLTPPSALPSSLSSTSSLFHSPVSHAGGGGNTISDYNVFRSPIAPLWEDPANASGGRWVLRLKKGVADRVWEDVVFALVGERIAAADDEARTDSPVNGVVLSVRKDEDILSLWLGPCSRSERDLIRDALRASLEPLFTPSALAAIQLDYKPHPVHSAPSSSSTSHHHHHHHHHTTTTTTTHHSTSSPRNGNGGEDPRRRHASHDPSLGGGDPSSPLGGSVAGGERRSLASGAGAGAVRGMMNGFSSYRSSSSTTNGGEEHRERERTERNGGERRERKEERVLTWGR